MGDRAARCRFDQVPCIPVRPIEVGPESTHDRGGTRVSHSRSNVRVTHRSSKPIAFVRSLITGRPSSISGPPSTDNRSPITDVRYFLLLVLPLVAIQLRAQPPATTERPLSMAAARASGLIHRDSICMRSTCCATRWIRRERWMTARMRFTSLRGLILVPGATMQRC